MRFTLSQIKRLTNTDYELVRSYIYQNFWGCIEIAKCFDKVGIKHRISDKNSGYYFGFFNDNILEGIFLFTNNKRFMLHFINPDVSKKVDLLKAIKHYRPEYMSGPTEMVKHIWKMFERTVKRYNYKKSMYMVLNRNDHLILSEELVIREAKVEDAKQYGNFLLTIEKHFGRNHMTINQLQKRIADRVGDHAYLIALDGQKLIGQGFVEDKINAFWQIGGVFTLPEVRGKGVASCLVSQLSERVLNEGYIPILAVLEENVPAVKAYEKLGFEKAVDFSIIEIEF